MLELLSINKRIQITFNDSAGYYASRVEDIASDHIVIAMPMSQGVPLSLDTGGNITVQFINNEQLYQCDSTLISRQFIPLPIWRIAIPENIERIQRRLLVRVQAILPVTVTIPDPPPLLPGTISSLTKDISAGGLQFITKYKFIDGQKIEIATNLPDSDTIMTAAEIVRIQERMHEDFEKMFGVAVKFMDIDEKKGRKIIQFIFNTQRKRR